MATSPRNVLFLCTGNSARSVMAEVLLNHWGKDRFHAYSAGSHPTSDVHPLTIELLDRMQLPTDGLRSKNWDEFARPTAPKMDFIITVCDNAAGEVCPVWPGQPIMAHWGFPDPAAAEGTTDQKRKVFAEVYRSIEARVKLLCALPLEALDRTTMQSKLRQLEQDQKVRA
jgi:arsenate reductase (thioredoxin)